MTQTNNPLRRYFRQPAIHVRLPSGGKYYPAGTLDMPPNGEIPILPMTAIDEITSRTPDALFNGSAVMDIMASCVPAVKNPWVMPMIDFNTLLVSVRLASFGHEMEIGSTCPKCGNNHALTIDLRTVLDNLSSPNYDESVSAGDLTCYFTPMTYRQVNDVSRTNFEDQKIMQALSNSELSEEDKLKKLGDAFRKITELTIKSISESIAVIKTADAMVTDKPSILEFLQNCPKHVFDQIRDHTVKLREATDLTPVSVTCEECSEQYKQPFTLDMSNFFGNAS
jgi:DNA-directed RNA polymerase subunit M/transcription elongation factor TFIIS